MWVLLLMLFLQQEPPGLNLQSISSALREGRFDQAVTLTRDALKTDERDYRLWTLQGLAYSGLNQKREALSDFARALSLSPNYLPALEAKAQMEYKTHDPHTPETLDRVLQIDPGNVVSHAMLASLAFQRQDCPAVVLHYAASESLIHNQPVALTEYGECLFQQQQSLKGLTVLNSVLDLEPQSWQARYNLAVADLLSHRAAEAIGILQPQLNSLNPIPRILDIAASSYEELGDTPHAVSLVRRAILSDPANSSLYLHFADLSFLHNSFQVGISMLNAGIQNLPHSAELLLARGILYVQLGEYDKAEYDFDRAAELDPTQPFSSVAQGLTELQRSNLDGALRITREQIRQKPADGYLNYLKAEILRQKGALPGTPLFAEALHAAETAVRLNPDFPSAHDLLGTFYLRLEQFDLARKQFETALAKSPDDESALYHLIVASRKSRRTFELPALMKRLSEAKAKNKNLEAQRNHFTFVEAASSSH